MRLDKLPREEFHCFLAERLKNCFATNSEELANNILDYINNHPYYSQQLASSIWNIGTLQPETEDVLNTAIDHIVTTHGLDYERLWMGISRTSKWILQRLASNSVLQTGEYPTSTIYSALKAIDLMAKTDREDADHLTHSQMIILAGLYSDMNDLDNALRTDERNVRLTMEGTRWGNTPQLQLIDRRMALAKTAYCLAKMGNFQRADSVYTAWQSVQYEGDHTREYFIADYLRERGRCFTLPLP